MLMQRTLKYSNSATGVGLHSGKKVKITLNPAPVDTGIVFRRVDLDPVVEIAAKPLLVGDTRLCTALINESGVRVATIEHLMSAFAGLGVDNVYVDVDAPEVPIMDGSAALFFFLIRSAGIVAQSAFKRFVGIKKTIEVSHGTPGEANYKFARFEPYNGFEVDCTIDFDHPLFTEGAQNIRLDFSKISYAKEISRARTFGFLAQYEQLRAMNLALGGSLDNAIVIDEYKVLNKGGLRYPNEFVRHKVLDAIGDLYLLGPVLGRFIAYKPGHALNNELLRALLAEESAWEYKVFDKKVTLPGKANANSPELWWPPMAVPAEIPA